LDDISIVLIRNGFLWPDMKKDTGFNFKGRKRMKTTINEYYD